MKRGLTVFAVCFFAIVAVAVGQAMAVDVYAEGAYTDVDPNGICGNGDLVVYIYANIGDTETPLRSAGVKLSYDPTQLTNPDAQKNESVWYLGSETYMDPEVDPVNGEVVFILGKLDEAEPGEGVPHNGQPGNRVLLGTVKFCRTADSVPPFVMGLTFGKEGSWDGQAFTFKNFVDVNQNVLDDNDGVVFDHPGFNAENEPVIVVKRGDANADGMFNVLDYLEVREFTGKTEFPVYVDCNGDGTLNVLDYMCVRDNT